MGLMSKIAEKAQGIGALLGTASVVLPYTSPPAVYAQQPQYCPPEVLRVSPNINGFLAPQNPFKNVGPYILQTDDTGYEAFVEKLTAQKRISTSDPNATVGKEELKRIIDGYLPVLVKGNVGVKRRMKELRKGEGFLFLGPGDFDLINFVK